MLLGDFNINLLRYGHQVKTKTYVDRISFLCAFFLKLQSLLHCLIISTQILHCQSP